MKNHPQQNKGVALLVAVLLTSVMLAVGIGVYQRTYKELYFSSFWKQAQIAFAAADSGLECAIYWDTHKLTSGVPTAQCGELDTGWDYSKNYSTSFFYSTSDSCVRVKITKDYKDPITSYSYATHIESRGSNGTCESQITNLRVVERALRIDYN